MAMKSQLQSLSKGSFSIMEYIEKKRSISDSLVEDLNPISDEDLYSYILGGLDSSYGPFTTPLMMKNDDFTVDDLMSLLLQEEAHLDQEQSRISTIVSESNSSTVLVSNRHPPSSSPMNTASAPSPSSQNWHSYSRRKLQSQLCSKAGDEAIDCWHRTNLTTYPSRFPLPKRQINYDAYNSSSIVLDSSWYFDLGATNHAFTDLNRLTIAENYQGSDKLQVGNGKKSSISHITSCFLNHIKLSNVLIVPVLSKHLLNVYRLTNDNQFYLEFSPRSCLVKNFYGKTLLRGDVKDGLY